MAYWSRSFPQRAWCIVWHPRGLRSFSDGAASAWGCSMTSMTSRRHKHRQHRLPSLPSTCYPTAWPIEQEVSWLRTVARLGGPAWLGPVLHLDGDGDRPVLCAWTAAGLQAAVWLPKRAFIPWPSVPSHFPYLLLPSPPSPYLIPVPCQLLDPPRWD